MIRVAVSGAAGRMGRLVSETVAAAEGLDLVAAYDPGSPGGEAAGLPVTGDPADVAAAEVVVEFTTPDVVLANLESWRAAGLHAVVGTSGFDADRIAAVTDLWGSGDSRCLIVPNFSVGAVVLTRLAEIAAPHFAAAEIVELHHDAKADAPSGTSLAIAAAIADGGGRQERRVESEELIPGARGATVAGVPVHAVRLPGLVAHHEVLFGNPGEALTLRHDSTDRASFMPGVLAAIKGVATLPDPVTVGLAPLLGL